MEINDILNIIFGGTSLLGVIGMIAYRKENRRLKQNEVKASDVETQRQQIDLVDYFKDKVLGVLDEVSKKQDAGNDNQSRILIKLDKLEDTVSDIVGFLDGPFDEWRKEQQEEQKGGGDV
jgi:hypothetical protein